MKDPLHSPVKTKLSVPDAILPQPSNSLCDFGPPPPLSEPGFSYMGWGLAVVISRGPPPHLHLSVSAFGLPCWRLCVLSAYQSEASGVRSGLGPPGECSKVYFLFPGFGKRLSQVGGQLGGFRRQEGDELRTA